jgi:hypothetical protein
MKPISDVVLGYVDHGLFLPIAQKLSEQCKHVYWWSPWERVGPKLEEGLVGDGFENITRVESIWDVKSKCDGFVFPDVGFGGEQKELASQGYPVWGHHGADKLETNRGLFLDTIKKLGLPLPEYEVVMGISKLRDHLKDKEDKWIKISKWRGNWETLHWRDWKHDESALDCYAYRFGPAKELIKFYVFDSIDTDIEDGIDAYNINGRYPSIVMHGTEIKDKSYLCSIQNFNDIDERLSGVSEAFAPVLESYGYQGFFSTEVRIKDDTGYFIDPTCRAASPPSQVMTELFSNLGEIVWAGANGELVDPEPSAQFGAQALITSSRESEEWEVLDIKEEQRQWIKCGFACEIDGSLCIPPHPLEQMIGWVVATGDSVEEVIDNLKKNCEAVPEGFTCDVDSLAKAVAEWHEAEEQGIDFTKQDIPEPATVID